MAHFQAMPATGTLVDPLKAAAIDTVKEVDSDSNSDLDSTQDISVLIGGDHSVHALELRRPTQVANRRIVSRTTRRSSRTVTSESMGRAEKHFFVLLDFISNASREAASLTEFWSGITQEYRTAVEERNELYQLVVELEEREEIHEQFKHEHERVLAEKLRIIQRLDKTISDAQNAVLVYRRRYEDSERENKSVREELHKATHSLTHAENERNNIQNNLSIALARIITIERERDSSRTQYARLEIDYHNACSIRDEYQSQRDSFERKYQSCLRDVERLTTDLIESESAKEALIEARDSLLLQVERLRAEISQITTEVKEWTKKYELCKEENDKYVVRVRHLESDNSELSREKQLVIRERDELSQQQVEYIRQVEHLKRERDSWKKQCESSDYEREQTDIRNDELRKQLREQTSLQRETESKMESLKLEFTEIKTKLVGSEQEVERCRTQIVELIEQKRELTEKAECAIAEKREAVALANTTLYDLTQLQGVHSEMQKEHTRLSESYKQLEIDLKKALSGCSGHQHIIVRLRERIDLLEDENSNNKKHSRETAYEIKQLRADCVRYDNIADDFRTKWTEKCIQVDRMLQEGVYCPCEHRGGKKWRNKKERDEWEKRRAAEDAQHLIDDLERDADRRKLNEEREELDKRRATEDARDLIDDMIRDGDNRKLEADKAQLAKDKAAFEAEKKKFQNEKSKPWTPRHAGWYEIKWNRWILGYILVARNDYDNGWTIKKISRTKPAKSAPLFGVLAAAAAKTNADVMTYLPIDNVEGVEGLDEDGCVDERYFEVSNEELIDGEDIVFDTLSLPQPDSDFIVQQPAVRPAVNTEATIASSSDADDFNNSGFEAVQRAPEGEYDMNEQMANID